MNESREKIRDSIKERFARLALSGGGTVGFPVGPTSANRSDTARPRVRKADSSALGNRQEVDMIRIGLALLLIVLPSAAFGQQSPDDPDADGKIRKLSERYFDAIERRDVKTLDDLLLDECMVFSPAARSTRRQSCWRPCGNRCLPAKQRKRGIP